MKKEDLPTFSLEDEISLWFEDDPQDSIQDSIQDYIPLPIINTIEKPKDEIKPNYVYPSYKPDPKYNHSRAYRNLIDRNTHAYWSMREEYQKYKKENDINLGCKTIKRKYFLVFMMEACVFGATQWIEAKEFLKEYHQWMEKQKKEIQYLKLIPPYETAGINKILREFELIECKTKQYVYWNGISMRDTTIEEVYTPKGKEEEEKEGKKVTLEIIPGEIVTIIRKNPKSLMDNKMESIEKAKKILESQRNDLLRTITLKSMDKKNL